MTFINPIDLLGLESSDVSVIDSATIKRAKRRVQAEIDLSDQDHIHHNGNQITKADAERVISELEDADKKEYYHFIANNKALNHFLSTGSTAYLHQIRQESIYKLEGFIEFISPFFSERYNKALFLAYREKDIDQIKLLLSTPFLVVPADRDKAYRNLLNAIKGNISELEGETKSIKDQDSAYDETNCDEIYWWVQDEVLNVDILNLLPPYFQSVRNQCASAIRNLSVNVFNEFKDSQTSLDLLKYALELKIDGLTKQRLEEDLDQIREIHEDHQEQERLAPILKKYATFFIEAKNKLSNIEAKTITPQVVQSWVNSSISIQELNGLDSTFNEIRNQIGLALRALSVAIWNKFNNIDVAWDLIDRAYRINVANNEIKENIQAAREQLDKFKKQIELERSRISKTTVPRPAPAPVSKPVTPPTKTSSNDGIGAVLVVLVLGIVFAAVAISKCNSSNSYSGYSSDSYSNGSDYSTTTTVDTATTAPVTVDTSAASDTYAPYYSNDYTSSEPIVTESPYKGNQLSNGASPLDNCFGSGRYAGNAWIRFDNSNASDAIVCLVEVGSERTIRNEYIRAGGSFKMSRIPSGTYYLKVYYGNDWNPNMENFCGTNGAFESDVHFSKSDSYSDWITVENNSYSYTTGTITLYSVSNGNMGSESMSASEFFKN